MILIKDNRKYFNVKFEEDIWKEMLNKASECEKEEYIQSIEFRGNN